MGHTLKILIADSQSLVRERICKLLRDRFGMSSVVECERYSDALAAMIFIRPDVLIVDINLPANGALMLLAQEEVENCCKVVVVMTRSKDDFMAEYCLKFGASNVWVKSDSTDELLQLVGVAMGETRKERPSTEENPVKQYEHIGGESNA